MDKLKMRSENLVDENIEFIAKKFPNAIVETRDENGNLSRMVDFDVLKQELSKEIVESDKERYQMTWPGKKQAILTANAPVAMTLRPCKEDSVDFNNTQNIYIEGDNLDVLKVIRETYHGKVKMIYIDPPYNTGNDFVYNDSFSKEIKLEENATDYRDEEGNIVWNEYFKQNPASNGRFHSDWLNMMYPRLKIAKDLLTDDGVIYISIDDCEQVNLTKLCDEIFGSKNKIAMFIWKSKSGGANDSNLVAVDHEYILMYAKNITMARTNLISYTDELESLYTGKDEFYQERGPYRPMLLQQKGLSFSKSLTYEIEAPDGSILVPEKGGAIWRWSKEKYLERLKNGFIEFKKVGNEYKVYTKQYLYMDYDGNKIDRGKLIRTVIDNIDGRSGTRLLQTIFSEKVFTNSKPIELVKQFVDISTNKNDLILDFFSGSATTAHAVMQLNAEDGNNRKYIMVQLPEFCDEQSEAYKAGYKNICEIGKERIRRAGHMLADEIKKSTRVFGKDKAPFENNEYDKSAMQMAVDKLDNSTIKDFEKLADKKIPDIGFRVFKLDSSNMKDTYYEPNQYSTNLLDQLDENIKPDRTPEDLLFQVLLDLGLMLDSKIEIKMINGKKVFVVGEYNEAIDPDLICCFDSDVDNNTVTEIAKLKPRFCVFRDSSMAKDSVATNFDQIFETYSPSTTRKVL